MARGPVLRLNHLSSLRLASTTSYRFLLGFCFQIEAYRIAAAAQSFGNSARRHVHPRFTGFAPETAEKFLKNRDNWFKILPSEVGPFVVVDCLVDRPLLDVLCPGCCGQRSLSFPHRLFLSIVTP